MTGANASDEQLLRDFVKGDRTAFSRLAERHERSLLGLSIGLLGGRRDMACDAVQETWVRVIRYGESFNGRSSFKTWLYRIAVNQCRSLRDARPSVQSADDEQRTPDPRDGPPEAAQAADQQARLQGAIEQLTPPQREVILLCYHQGLTHEQAAEIIDIPLGTLKSRLHAALKGLRERLPAETEL